MLILANTKRVLEVKPVIHYGTNQIYFLKLFRDMMDVQNFHSIETKYTSDFVDSEAELGIIELRQFLGISRKTSLPLYFYQKCQNKYIGTIRLLAEALYAQTSLSQDLGLMVPKAFDDEESFEKVDKLVEFALSDGGYTLKHMLRPDYPDFTIFFEKVGKYLDFYNVVSESKISEATEKANIDIELGQKNAKVLKLARLLPAYLEE